ncbi:hypothetical protein [Bradyrhizobium sp.]|uniref:hypothetical protein n=1 Tax=Bradyrhizobium sp. TaxID=376 RepID=UPI0025B98063|nr:hypothetical protein [Bradyrhizobium sp.]
MVVAVIATCHALAARTAQAEEAMQHLRTLDPDQRLGDFATRGYLRNVAKAKDPEIVQRLQHNSFLTGIDAALAQIKGRPSLTYGDVLQNA